MEQEGNLFAFGCGKDPKRLSARRGPYGSGQALAGREDRGGVSTSKYQILGPKENYVFSVGFWDEGKERTGLGLIT